jgi:hypothetical protein
MRFWKEKSVEDIVTLGPTARATLVYIKYLVCPSVRDGARVRHRRTTGPGPTKRDPAHVQQRRYAAKIPFLPGPGLPECVACVRAPVEVLKPRSWEPNIEVLKPEILRPSVRLSRSWNSGPESQMQQHGSNRRREPRPSVWVLKPSCRGS